MKIIVTQNYQDSSTVVANMICELINENPTAKLGLATGGTPVPIYEALIEKNKKGEVDFAKVRTVNLDEYCGLEPSHDQSYRYFMDNTLFNHINIDKNNTYVASGVGDYDQNSTALDTAVEEGGLPDFQLLGIGANGHIAFNEPGEFLRASSHTEPLTQSTIDSNSRYFEKPEDVPTLSITMGLKGILAAKLVVLVATGASKKQAISDLLNNDKITTQNPSTFLKLHQNAVIVIDKELADLVGYKA